jgi:hypothetical protein
MIPRRPCKSDLIPDIFVTLSAQEADALEQGKKRHSTAKAKKTKYQDILVQNCHDSRVQMSAISELFSHATVTPK